MINIPVFLSSDNNYAAFVATTIASICDNTKSFCDFYILDGGITDENKTKICELKKQFNNFDIEFLAVDLEKYFKDLPETKYISKAMYSRFLIPELKPEIDKAIYSDVDVVVLGDIAEMYNEDLQGHALGAIWEEFAEKTFNIERKRSLKLKDNHKYFASGNLFIDCKKWRENDITNKLIELIQSNTFKLNCPDQDALNIYFNDNYKILSPKYCWINQNFYFYKDCSDIIIRHFNGFVKPWFINPDTNLNLMQNIQDFWNYAKLTEFFNDLYQKTLNKQEQDMYIRHSKIIKIRHKKLGLNL